MRGDLRFRLPGISPSGRLRLSWLVGMPCSRAICSLFRLCAMSCTCTAQCIAHSPDTDCCISRQPKDCWPLYGHLEPCSCHAAVETSQH